jgi:hypothetical protein
MSRLATFIDPARTSHRNIGDMATIRTSSQKPGALGREYIERAERAGQPIS